MEGSQLSKSISIQSSFGDYDVQTGCNLVETFEHIADISDAYLLVDDNVFSNYQHLFFRIPSQRILKIDAREINKSLDQVADICEWMSNNSASRSSVIVGVGGGITQDLTAFAASVFHRGVPYMLVPTTLLSMVDSCVGGKSSINVRESKNIIGTFQGPTSVLIAEDFILSLSTEDIASGLGEVGKFGLLESQHLLKLAVSCLKSGSISRDTVEEIVQLSLNIKQPFIESDEFDRGIRRTLNYGHSIGHAIEGLTNYSIPHGIAVAIGCHVENGLLQDRGTSEKMMGYSTDLISAIPGQFLNLSASLNPMDVLTKLKKDKKASSGVIKMVALEDFGYHSIVEIALDSEFAERCVELLRDIQ